MQQPFFDFLDAFAPPTSTTSRLHWSYEINVGGFDLEFFCLNTAWCSSLAEDQGALRFPIELVFSSPPPHLRIAVLHHPFNWFENRDARRLRRALEENAEIILTGHEHVHTRRRQVVSTGERNEFIEGAVLGDPNESLSTGFNLVMLDLAKALQRFSHFQWNGKLYSPGVDDASWETTQVRALQAHREFSLSTSCEQMLEDLGISIHHPAREHVSLTDLFVYPDVRRVSYNQATQGRVQSSKGLLASDEGELVHLFITGGERSSKTALGKKFFRDLYDGGRVPLLLRGSDIHFVDPDQFAGDLQSTFKNLYAAGTLEQLRQLPRSKRALIIDDFHAAKITPKRIEPFFDFLEDTFGVVILLSNDLAHQINQVSDARRMVEERPHCFHYHIEQFGHLRRDDLVERWMTLDPDVANDPETLARRVVHAERIIDAVIGKNFVPAYPLFILSMLQGIDTMGGIDLQASTHGYFYELLIKNDLFGNSSGIEYDIKGQFLAHLAYRSFKWRTDAVSTEEFDLVHESYEEEYAIRVPAERLRAELVRNNVLLQVGDTWTFRYDYIRLYFIAVYLNNNLRTTEVLEDLTFLSATLDEFVSENPSFRSSGGGRNWAEEELIGSGLPNMIVYARSMVRKYGS